MYYSRLIEKEIELKLRTSGAIVVAGPKFCGKTTTCMLYQKSFIKLNTKQAIAMARMNPKAVLPGETSRLIDEWQKAPDIWNQEKDDLDIKYEFGSTSSLAVLLQQARRKCTIAGPAGLRR